MSARAYTSIEGASAERPGHNAHAHSGQLALKAGKSGGLRSFAEDLASARAERRRLERPRLDVSAMRVVRL